MTAKLTPLDDALRLVAAHAPRITQTQTIASARSTGRVLAHAVIAPVDLPRFDNTGVDGYALIHDPSVTSWKLAGASYAGAPFEGTVGKGEAVRIATGAMLPRGADTVVMQEDCSVGGDTLLVATMPQKGASIRKKGADIAAGTTALPALHRIQPQDMALLGALGLGEVTVLRPLRVAVLSSGNELAKAGDAVAAGQVVDTNSAMLQDMLESACVHVTILPSLPDTYEETLQALRDAGKTHDIVITTGGVSVGDHDHVRDALHALAKPLFWKLALRPGKPVLVVRDGACLYAGLPGNPVSAFVTALLVVRPMLDACYGKPAALPPAFPLPLAAAIAKPSHLRVFARACFEGQGVRPYPDQSSNLYMSLAAADGLLDLPEGQETFAQGDTVLFRPFYGWL